MMKCDHYAVITLSVVVILLERNRGALDVYDSIQSAFNDKNQLCALMAHIIIIKTPCERVIGEFEVKVSSFILSPCLTLSLLRDTWLRVLFNLLAVALVEKKRRGERRRRHEDEGEKASLLMILMMIYELVLKAPSLAYTLNVEWDALAQQVRWRRREAHRARQKRGFSLLFMVMTVRYVFSSPSTTVKSEKFIEFWWVFCAALFTIHNFDELFYSLASRQMWFFSLPLKVMIGEGCSGWEVFMLSRLVGGFFFQ